MRGGGYGGRRGCSTAWVEHGKGPGVRGGGYRGKRGSKKGEITAGGNGARR